MSNNIPRNFANFVFLALRPQNRRTIVSISREGTFIIRSVVLSNLLFCIFRRFDLNDISAVEDAFDDFSGRNCWNFFQRRFWAADLCVIDCFWSWREIVEVTNRLNRGKADWLKIPIKAKIPEFYQNCPADKSVEFCREHQIPPRRISPAPLLAR